jgi:hypothetical protein
MATHERRKEIQYEHGLQNTNALHLVAASVFIMAVPALPVSSSFQRFCRFASPAYYVINKHIIFRESAGPATDPGHPALMQAPFSGNAGRRRWPPRRNIYTRHLFPAAHHMTGNACRRNETLPGQNTERPRFLHI